MPVPLDISAGHAVGMSWCAEAREGLWERDFSQVSPRRPSGRRAVGRSRLRFALFAAFADASSAAGVDLRRPGTGT